MAGYGYGYGFGLKRKPLGVAYDALASSYFAAVPNAFDAARKTIINTLIAGLRSDGNLTKLDRLWLFANTTTGNAVIDVIGLNSATLVNAPAFVTDQGYTGDGATSYINSNYNPATNGANFTKDSASISIYSRTNNNGVYVEMGCGDYPDAGWSESNIAPYYSSANQGRLNSQAQPTAAAANSLGFHTILRTGAVNILSYQNGTLFNTAAAASTDIPSLNMYISGLNRKDVLTSPSNRQYSVALVGSGTIDQAALYTRIQQYMTDLGTQV